MKLFKTLSDKGALPASLAVIDTTPPSSSTALKEPTLDLSITSESRTTKPKAGVIKTPLSKAHRPEAIPARQKTANNNGH